MNTEHRCQRRIRHHDTALPIEARKRSDLRAATKRTEASTGWMAKNGFRRIVLIGGAEPRTASPYRKALAAPRGLSEGNCRRLRGFSETVGSVPPQRPDSSTSHSCHREDDAACSETAHGDRTRVPEARIQGPAISFWNMRGRTGVLTSRPVSHTVPAACARTSSGALGA